ncbi:MAG: YraN family protein [Chlamydiae bacterium]|nr:YraN family protein [Chlamydiota bacterium]MBI3277806.1 YraN family protein [Chlamydiota bacterium]
MNIEVGKEGEKAAEKFLRQKGYKILQRNYRSSLGEIDLVCLDRKKLTFVEVKTNAASNDFGRPESRVDTRKQKQIIRTALGFIKESGAKDFDYRFDVVSVYLKDSSPQRIEHFENAFEADGYLF